MSLTGYCSSYVLSSKGIKAITVPGYLKNILAGAMAQGVKYRAHKHKDPSSDPQNTCKTQEWWQACSLSAAYKEVAERGGS